MEPAPPRGTTDLLPPESERMRRLYDLAHGVATLYGYQYAETPAFESTDLFVRTSGATSDVVQKEMYTFEDKGGRQLTLRPEGTAPVVRAVLGRSAEVSLPFKGYYVEPMWRYGRPQKGRLREFRQFGVELIGSGLPAADAETILLGHEYLQLAGIRDLRLEVNSLGDEVCRPAYRERLLTYLEANREGLRDEHRDRFRDNPLRVLDCNDESCRAVARDAPKIVDNLCGPCREHYDGVLAALDDEGLSHHQVDTLVRGLDYYVRTAFEYVSPVLPEGQASVGGGGRYDGLAEVLGLTPTPGVGFALGLERILIALDAAGIGDLAARFGVFVVTVGPNAFPAGRELVRAFRQAGVPAQVPFEDRPLNAQFRMADRSGAAYAAVLGERELSDGTVTIRRLADGVEETVPREEAVKRLASSDV
jgi:histidyl-tRNA synthetase